MGATGDLAESAPFSIPPEEVLEKAGAENFSVATRLVPRRYRRDLLALYGFARLVDDLGDLSSGDRLAHLDWAEAELRRAFEGAARHRVFVEAGELARRADLSMQPFLDLIEANRLDQVKKRCATYEELVSYCSLSANPVGRVVLGIFHVRSPETTERSDEVCTALQIIEHLQDVREDYLAGRIYLPAEDLDAYGVAEHELGAERSTPALCRLVAFEAARARALLRGGLVLVGALRGFARLSIAGFVGGGLAQLDALERSRFDVLAVPVKASKFGVARRSASVYLAGCSQRWRRRR